MIRDAGTDISLWDALAPQYDAWYETPLGAYVLQVEIAALVELAGELTGVRVLEVGCGTGRFGHVFAQRGVCVVGIDLSGVMLEEAGKNTGGILSLCQADGGWMPFRVSSFDLVLAVTLLEFVPKPGRVLDEMWRVLRPGGRLLVGALNAWSLWTFMRRRSNQEPFTRAHFFSPPEFKDQLARFGRVTWRGAVFIPPWVKGYGQTFWGRLERIGAGITPWFGAFLAGCVHKQPGG